MALNAIVDSIDGLSDALKSEYKAVTEGDNKGKFILDVTGVGGYGLDNVDGLKSTYLTTKTLLDKANVDLTGVNSALAGYSGLKLKPSEIATKIKKLDDLEKLDPTIEADKIAQTKIDAFKTGAEKDFNLKLTEEQTKSKTYRGQVETLIRDSALITAISKADGIPELLMPAIAPRVKVVEAADGTLSTIVLDGAGNVAQSFKDNKFVNMTVEELVNTFKANETFGGAFKASGKSGSGVPPKGAGSGNAGATTMTAKEWLDKTGRATPEERQKLFQEAAAGKFTIAN